MKLKKNVTTQPLNDQLLVLDLDGNIYFSLNESARFMLETLLSGKSPEETAQEAEKIFDASFDVLLNDVNELIQSLRKNSLICE